MSKFECIHFECIELESAFFSHLTSAASQLLPICMTFVTLLYYDCWFIKWSIFGKNGERLA